MRRKACSAHGTPAGDPPVRQKPEFAHGTPAGDPPVRQSPNSRTAPPPEILPCVRRPVPRTAMQKNTKRLALPTEYSYICLPLKDQDKLKAEAVE